MRLITASRGLLGAWVVSLAGCDSSVTCEDLLNCAGANGARAGTAGASGAAGSAGRGGAGGSGGMAGSAGSQGSGAQGGDGGSSGEGTAGSSTAGTAAGGSAGIAGDAGESGAGGGGEPVCDPELSPSEDDCVIHEDFGVFVSPAGNDGTADGSRERPFGTLQRAVDAAIASGKRVYACAGQGAFEERLELAQAAGGMEMFGGFSCSDWSYDSASKSRVSSPSTLALFVDGVVGLVIEDFAFEAADAAMPGESSLGALVVASTNVALRRVHLEAGKGMHGAHGTRADFVFPLRTELDGNDAMTTSGAMPKSHLCPNGAETSGGGGGDAQTGGQDGGNGSPNHPGPGGEGGDSEASGCGAGGAGLNGAPAPDASPAPGAMSLGSLTATGWTPGAGSDGADGLPGQGGGGGASSASGGGGGGGAGGCGGAGGKAGQGGGASIALAVFESSVVIEQSSLVAADAGHGGNGVIGQDGQMEAGFAGNGTLGGCQGGAGGFGGAGAASGGGAGGISAGVVWSGETAPLRPETSIVTGLAGSKGLGGEPGVNDGVAGVAEQEHEVS